MTKSHHLLFVFQEIRQINSITLGKNMINLQIVILYSRMLSWERSRNYPARDQPQPFGFSSAD